MMVEMVVVMVELGCCRGLRLITARLKATTAATNDLLLMSYIAKGSDFATMQVADTALLSRADLHHLLWLNEDRLR